MNGSTFLWQFQKTKWKNDFSKTYPLINDQNQSQKCMVAIVIGHCLFPVKYYSKSITTVSSTLPVFRWTSLITLIQWNATIYFELLMKWILPLQLDLKESLVISVSASTQLTLMKRALLQRNPVCCGRADTEITSALHNIF